MTRPSRFRPTRQAISVAALVLSVLACGAAPAGATFHEVSIREVYPGSAALPESEYVELQMWAAGQNLVDGHTLEAYGPTGAPTGTTTFTGNVSGGANQSTILLASAAAEAAFGVAPDAVMKPNQLDPAGGAACWENLDCVSWGNFSGSLPSPAGTPAPAIPNEMALRRTISPGCATLLEPGDDHDNSAVDFSAVFPSPRPNSAVPSEHICASGGQQGGADDAGNPNGHGAPQTSLRRKPPHKTHDSTPTFRFSSSEARSSFQCKLDSKPFRSCRSPFTTPQLSLGRHTLKVRARDDSGKLDPSPATYTFKVVTKRG